MSTSTSKRRRIEEDIGEESTKESSDDSSQEIGNGDTEIFSTLIPMMTDVNVLKTCRLVCKSWNQFACESLRKLPRICSVVINENRPGKVDECLALIVGNKKLRLSSPFRKFKVYAQNFRDESFLRFLKYVRDNDNNYSIELVIHPNDDCVDPVELQNVLTTNLNNFRITKLSLYGKIIGDGPDAASFQPEKIQWPHLKMLDIENDVLTNDKILVLCDNICHYLSLKKLSVLIHDGEAVEKLKKMMSTGGMKSVERMFLHFEDVDISLEDWEYICARIMEIPCIKKFKIWMGPDLDDCHYNALKIMIEHFADSVESVTADVMPMSTNKCFPKLREISVKCFTSFYEWYYPVEKYPILRKATFSPGSNAVCENPSAGKVSLGIEELYLKDLWYLQDSDCMLKLICAAGLVFPNVYSFSISPNEMEFTSETLMTICKSFPNMTALELDVVLSEDSILSGLKDFVVEWLENGWPLEKIPRVPCLVDFQGLEKLSLGKDVLITNELFTYCLSKVPKLQYLTFYWNCDISALDIREGVGHLKRITAILPTNHKWQWADEMKRLRDMLPTVVELKELQRWTGRIVNI